MKCVALLALLAFLSYTRGWITQVNEKDEFDLAFTTDGHTDTLLQEVLKELNEKRNKRSNGLPAVQGKVILPDDRNFYGNVQYSGSDNKVGGDCHL